MNDAAFREALDAFGVACWDSESYEVRTAARARVLALYAEREEGAACVVMATGRETTDGALTTIRVAPVEGVALPLVQCGDRVRVVRVECWRDTAGRAHPKEGQ